MHPASVILLLLLGLLAGSATARNLALVGGKLYPAPEAAPIEQATVLISNGVITAVGDQSLAIPVNHEVLDLTGKVLVAGFWNSHVHLLPEPYRGAARQPAAGLNAVLEAQYTRWGFTTVFDIASLPGDALALRRRIAEGEVRGPHVLTVDAPFFPEHGTPIYVKSLLEALQVPSFEVPDAATARTRAAAQLAAGADGIKLFAGAIVGGDVGVLPMRVELARAAVAEAKRAGKVTFAHPSNDAGLQVAIDSGVDVLVHTAPMGGPWSDAFAARLVAEDMALVPTLTLVEEEARREGLPPEALIRMKDVTSQQVRSFVAAGGQLLFGTDAGYMDVYDTTREYQLLAAAGLDWRQILASLTTQPSSRFGHAGNKGRVAPGLDADLAVLRSDPATHVEAFADVALTLKSGQIIYRQDGDGGN